MQLMRIINLKFADFIYFVNLLSQQWAIEKTEISVILLESTNMQCHKRDLYKKILEK